MTRRQKIIKGIISLAISITMRRSTLVLLRRAKMLSALREKTRFRNVSTVDLFCYESESPATMMK